MLSSTAFPLTPFFRILERNFGEVGTSFLPRFLPSFFFSFFVLILSKFRRFQFSKLGYKSNCSTFDFPLFRATNYVEAGEGTLVVSRFSRVHFCFLRSGDVYTFLTGTTRKSPENRKQTTTENDHTHRSLILGFQIETPRNWSSNARGTIFGLSN